MMLMAKYAVPAMRDNEPEAGVRGSIVNLGSVAGLRGGTPSLLYPTSKGAVVNMTRAMAAHHAKDGVRVNCVCPGMLYTPMVYDAEGGMSAEVREARRRRSLLQTEGNAWDCAGPVRFLAGGEARWITGTVLTVDAGATCALAVSMPDVMMQNTSGPNIAAHAVSRSRGKRPGESLYRVKLRERRIANGQARSSDESESDEEHEPGWFDHRAFWYILFHRKVVHRSDGVVVKSGKRLAVGEAEAMRVARKAGIPVPLVYQAKTFPDGKSEIHMDYVQGESLDKLWPTMSVEEKKDVCRELREILEQMRSIAPPCELIGACDGTEIRDTRVLNTYHHPPCCDEETFNGFLLSSLFKITPEAVREALALHLRTDHRIVLSHCDLAPRNILVQDGKITGLVDWEDGGWYPEYWDYVKFFQRPATTDWKQYAKDIFPKLYHDELVAYTAISRWQDS
ncbi:hypothetical protein H633G_10016 [Metarhizium anisopliae BRIP 53284]|nr:hypothetical protein H633G_10016 [Metarhizium anisopliae BRIP 53284]